MKNPWVNIVYGKEIYLKDDQNSLEKIKDKLKLSLGHFPQPFLGSPSAPFYLLLSNPGLSEEDMDEIRWNRVFSYYRKLLPENAAPNFSQLIANTFFVVELFPYHSVRFDPRILKSQFLSVEYNKYLVENAIQNDKTIIIGRAVRSWFNLVPQLKTYEKCYFLSKNRSIVLSETTLFPSLLINTINAFQHNIKL